MRSKEPETRSTVARREYRAARVAARAAASELVDALSGRRSMRQVAAASDRAKLAAAKLYTAAACILSPP